MSSKRKENSLLLTFFSFVIIFEPHDVVFAEIIAELDFDERQRLVCAVAEAMIGLRRDVYVLALIEP